MEPKLGGWDGPTSEQENEMLRQERDEIETKAREIYLSLYGAIGGRWECVETKDVWRDKARAALSR